jgi:hypothetical protein
MTQAIDRRAVAKHTTEMVLDQELERAGRVATQRVRDRVHDIPPERRHLVRIGGRQVEVVETEAVEEAMAS